MTSFDFQHLSHGGVIIRVASESFWLYLPKCLKGGRVHIVPQKYGRKKIGAAFEQKLANSDGTGSTAKMSNGPMNCTKENQEGNTKKVMGESFKKILGSAGEFFEQADVKNI